MWGRILVGLGVDAATYGTKGTLSMLKGFAKGTPSNNIVGNLMGGAAGVGIGYGIMKGSSAIADEIDEAREGGAKIGGFYSTAIRGAGFISGGSMMLTSPVRAVGRSISGVVNQKERVAAFGGMRDAVRASEYSQHKMPKGWDRGLPNPIKESLIKLSRRDRDKFAKPYIDKAVATFREKNSRIIKVRDVTSNFSFRGLLTRRYGAEEGKKGTRGIAKLGTGAGQAAWFPLKGAIMPIADVAGGIYGSVKAIGGRGFSNPISNWTGRNPGGRLLGWGMYAGAGVTFAKHAIPGNSPAGPMTAAEAETSLAGRNLALAGQQMHVPGAGGPQKDGSQCHRWTYPFIT
jgi:hypothetical protein